MAEERPDDQYDMVFAPARYGALNAEVEGRWTVLSADDGTPLGIAWTDGAEAAGFLQAGPNEVGEGVWEDFAISASLKIPAVAAYQMAQRKAGIVAEKEVTGKLTQVYRDFTKLLDRASALVAAGLDNEEPLPQDSHIYLTLDDVNANQVLELVRNDETGMYIRDNGEWVPIDADADNQRVWDRVILDVTPEAAEVYDAAAREGEVTADKFTEVLIPDEVQQ